MAILHLTDVTTTQGSKTVTVNDVGASDNLSAYNNGNYQIDIDGFNGLPYQIASVSGNVITLAVNAPVSLSGRAATISVSLAPLIEIQTQANNLNAVATDLINTQDEFLTSTDPSFDYTGVDGQVRTHVTMQAFDDKFVEIENESGNLTAQRSVTAQAISETNKLRYGASGFVQVDTSMTDVNLGISTPATTPNEFVLGKSVCHISGSEATVNQVNVQLPPAADGLQNVDGTTFAGLNEAITAGNAIESGGGDKLLASNLHIENLVTLRSKGIDLGQYGYPLGSRQYGSSSFTCEDGTAIALIDNPSQSECRMYDNGWNVDTTTLGKVVDFNAITDAEKSSFIADSRNNISNKPNGGLEQVVYQVFTHSCLGHYDSSLGYLSTLAIMGGEGFSTTEERGLFTKDGWNYIPIAYQHEARNQGAYHPVYNNGGAASKGTNNGLTNGATSTADAFTGQTGGSIGTSSGRPDGKFYDAIYASDVTDLRLDVSNKVDLQRWHDTQVARAINGKASERNLEKQQYLFTVEETVASSGSSTGTGINISDTSSINTGNRVRIYDASGVSQLDAEIIQVVANTSINTDGVFNRVNGATYYVEVYELTDEPCTTWTDCFGNPDDIAAAFPDGFHGTWMGVTNPEAGGAIDVSLSRKLITNFQGVSTTDGATWSPFNPTLNTTLNSIAITPTANRVTLFNYDYAPNFTTPNSRERVDCWDKSWFASNHHNVGYGCTLTQSTLGKVPTGAGTNCSRQGVLIEFGITDTGLFDSGNWAGGAPTHDTINLAGVDSPAVKMLFYTHLTEYGIPELYVVGKEMVFDSVYDGRTVTVNAGDTVALSEGDIVDFRGFNNSSIQMVKMGNDVGSTTYAATFFDGLYVDSDGFIRSGTDGSINPNYNRVWNGNGFGDDNQFDIVNGEAYVPDLNGNTIKVFCHKVNVGSQTYIQPSIQQG